MAPTVTAVTDNVAATVTNSSITFTMTFSEAVTGVSLSSFTATNGTVASVTQVDFSHYTVVVNPTSGVASGNVALSLVGAARPTRRATPRWQRTCPASTARASIRWRRR